MSGQYTAGGKRRSSQSHARHFYTCTCGKDVSGNGAKASHRKACGGKYLSWSQALAGRATASEDEARHG